MNDAPAEEGMVSVDLTDNPSGEPARTETSALAMALRRIRNEMEHPGLPIASYDSTI